MSRLIVALVAGLLVPTVSGADQICDRPRNSTDAIIILGQKKHSSYDASHTTSLGGVLHSLDKYYPHVVDADVMIWHEGDLSQSDLPVVSFPLILCNLKNTPAWVRILPPV